VYYVGMTRKPDGENGPRIIRPDKPQLIRPDTPRIIKDTSGAPSDLRTRQQLGDFLDTQVQKALEGDMCEDEFEKTKAHIFFERFSTMSQGQSDLSHDRTVHLDTSQNLQMLKPFKISNQSEFEKLYRVMLSLMARDEKELPTTRRLLVGKQLLHLSAFAENANFRGLMSDIIETFAKQRPQGRGYFFLRETLKVNHQHMNEQHARDILSFLNSSHDLSSDLGQLACMKLPTHEQKEWKEKTKISSHSWDGTTPEAVLQNPSHYVSLARNELDYDRKIPSGHIGWELEVTKAEGKGDVYDSLVKGLAGHEKLWREVQWQLHQEDVVEFRTGDGGIALDQDAASGLIESTAALAGNPYLVKFGSVHLHLDGEPGLHPSRSLFFFRRDSYLKPRAPTMETKTLPLPVVRSADRSVDLYMPYSLEGGRLVDQTRLIEALRHIDLWNLTPAEWKKYIDLDISDAKQVIKFLYRAPEELIVPEKEFLLRVVADRRPDLMPSLMRLWEQNLVPMTQMRIFLLLSLHNVPWDLFTLHMDLLSDMHVHQRTLLAEKLWPTMGELVKAASYLSQPRMDIGHKTIADIALRVPETDFATLISHANTAEFATLDKSVIAALVRSVEPCELPDFFKRLDEVNALAEKGFLKRRPVQKVALEEALALQIHAYDFEMLEKYHDQLMVLQDSTRANVYSKMYGISLEQFLAYTAKAPDDVMAHNFLAGRISPISWQEFTKHEDAMSAHQSASYMLKRLGEITWGDFIGLWKDIREHTLAVQKMMAARVYGLEVEEFKSFSRDLNVDKEVLEMLAPRLGALSVQSFKELVDMQPPLPDNVLVTLSRILEPITFDEFLELRHIRVLSDSDEHWKALVDHIWQISPEEWRAHESLIRSFPNGVQHALLQRTYPPDERDGG
jgi:hypothetical protein